MKPKRNLPTSLTTDPELIDAAIKQAVIDALIDHKKAGNPVAVWENGKVVIVPPHKIPDFEDS